MSPHRRSAAYRIGRTQSPLRKESFASDTDEDRTSQGIHDHQHKAPVMVRSGHPTGATASRVSPPRGSGHHSSNLPQLHGSDSKDDSWFRSIHELGPGRPCVHTLRPVQRRSIFTARCAHCHNAVPRWGTVSRCTRCNAQVHENCGVDMLALHRARVASAQDVARARAATCCM